MQEMIGLVASVVIGAILLLLLAVIQWRGQHTSIDAAQFASAKVGMLDLAELLEEDLTNLGAGLAVADMRNTGGAADVTPNQGGFTGASYAFDTTGTGGVRRIEFYSWADTSSSVANPLTTVASPYVVRYEWRATGETVQVFQASTNTYVSRPTYLVRRFVNGTAAGESMDTMTRLRFDLFDASNTATSTLQNVRTVEVSLRAVSPLGGGDPGMVDTEVGLAPAVSETRWHKTFRPPNLGRKSS